MKRVIENPVTTENKFGNGMRTTHPAFGQIGASRVSGRTNLFGSDFDNQHFVAIRIHHSELVRDLHRDRYHAKDEIIEVCLSEAQWATFVSAMNQGDGVPCTIQHINRQYTPLLPDPERRDEQFAGEARDILDGVLSEARDLRESIKEMGLSKGKANDIMSKLDSFIMNLDKNIPFVAESFDEHMEKTIEKAKQEIHGYVTAATQRADIASLKGETKSITDE